MAAKSPDPLLGKPAPDFTLAGSDGASHTLADHRGKPVVVYFYPKDDTPGCTAEACDFRDNLARLQAAGAVLYGISPDPLEDHAKFIDKYTLTFVLLSDPTLEAHRAYGAFGQKTLYGKTFDGVLRSTFLVDRDGRIARVWRNVRVPGHVERVLEALEALPAT